MKQDNLLSIIDRRVDQLAARLRACNDTTENYGLTLSESSIAALAQKRVDALVDTGRVEFGESIIDKLALAFCDSDYIEQEEYEQTLLELTDAFYYFKNDSLDLVSDDELIEFMRKCFDDHEGSIDYLIGTSLEELCHFKRFGEEYKEDE